MLRSVALRLTFYSKTDEKEPNYIFAVALLVKKACFDFDPIFKAKDD